jgi:hypothetical protein
MGRADADSPATVTPLAVFNPGRPNWQERLEFWVRLSPRNYRCDPPTRVGLHCQSSDGVQRNQHLAVRAK